MRERQRIELGSARRSHGRELACERGKKIPIGGSVAQANRGIVI